MNIAEDPSLILITSLHKKIQGRKRSLDTPKRMRERRKERERKVEGEIYRERERYRERGRDKRERERERGERDREVKGIERVKGAQSKPNPSPNAFPKLCDARV